MLSLLVLFLELIQALVREAFSIGLISHGHPVYIYDPLVQCNTSTSADNRNDTGSSACNEEAGIALLVILGLICLAPCFWYLVIRLYFNKQLSYVSQQDEANSTGYSEEHCSPILSCFINFFLNVEKICCGGCTEQSATPSISSNASFCTYTLKSVAVTIYLFGKFLEPILHKYGECIDCDRDCVKILSHISTAALFLSTIMFHTFPHLVKKIAHGKKWEYKPSKKYSTLGVFSILLKAQSTYSSMVKIFHDNSYCGASEQAWGWIFLVLTTGIATIVVILKLPKQFCIGNCRSNILIVLVLFPYGLLLLLGSNLQPLDCVFLCDMLPSRTLSKFTTDRCCDVRNNVIARLSIIAIVCLPFLILTICATTLFVSEDLLCRCRKSNRIHPENETASSSSSNTKEQECNSGPALRREDQEEEVEDQQEH